GRQERRRASFRRDRVEVRPAVLLPWEDDPVAVGPEELVFGDGVAEDASASLVRAEDLAGLAGRRVHDADRPRLSLAVGAERLELLVRRKTQVSQAFSVRRPGGIGIPVHARVEPGKRLRGEVVGAEEAVVAPAADERQA